jgi:cephalosporin hydroxylase
MNYENVPGWFDFHTLYKDRVREADKKEPSVFVEIGTFLGKSACFMGQEIKASKRPIKFYTVDPFDEPNLPESELQFMSSLRVQGEKRSMADIARDYVKGCELDKYVNVVQASSKEALNLITEPKVDFVFVDGDHAYEAVRTDINGWWPRLKMGCYMAGHDYGSFMSVNRAVREIFYRFSIETQGGSWLVKKTREDL